MEQRRLRLGDILDDYCPRERRVTNHAIVAMVEDDIKQTRCATCDAEHPYKGGKPPRRRKKDVPAALYQEVLASLPETETGPHLTAADPDVDETEPRVTAPVEDRRDESVEECESPQQSDDGVVDVADVEEGPVHRPLIRATLPRPEGQKDARPLPDFTVRHGGRGNGQFRGDSRTRHRGGAPDAHRGQGGARFAGGRQGHGRGGGGRGPGGGGFRSPQLPRHGGKKRSR